MTTLMDFPLIPARVWKMFERWSSFSLAWVVKTLLTTSDGLASCSHTRSSLMWTSLLLIQPLYLQQHTYKDPSQDLVPNNLTIRYFRFLELFLTYMRI